MDYRVPFRGLKRFGSTERDIYARLLGIEAGQVRDNVVIAPWWEPPTLPGLGEATLLSQGEGTGLWDISTEAGGPTSRPASVRRS